MMLQCLNKSVGRESLCDKHPVDVQVVPVIAPWQHGFKTAMS